MEILVATTNNHKLKEIRHILGGIKVMGSAISVNENGKTFEENALKKARAAAKKYKQIALADDSGLMVDCLNGKPGIKSARFANPPTAENYCTKLLKVMGNEKCVMRGAKFVCAIAIVTPNGKSRVVKGIVHGKIAFEMKGKNGFGYDPLFIPRGFSKTFAEMPASKKNKLSHRYKALQKAKIALKTLEI